MKWLRLWFCRKMYGWAMLRGDHQGAAYWMAKLENVAGWDK